MMGVDLFRNEALDEKLELGTYEMVEKERCPVSCSLGWVIWSSICGGKVG
jgi:hypothetical protein